MVKKKSTKKETVKEVTVEKPKDAPVTSTEPLVENKSEVKDQPDIKQIVQDSIKENLTVLNSIGKDQVKEKPKQKRKPRTKKEVVEKETVIIKQAEDIAKGHSTGFYVGLAIGVLIASVGGYYVYLKFKEWRNKPENIEKRLIEQLEKEGVKKVEDVRETS